MSGKILKIKTKKENISKKKLNPRDVLMQI